MDAIKMMGTAAFDLFCNVSAIDDIRFQCAGVHFAIDLAFYFWKCQPRKIKKRGGIWIFNNSRRYLFLSSDGT
jgi:hypothetical protein